MSDPGLQRERTALAWQRTALSAAVAAVLLLRKGITQGAVLDLAAGALLVGVLALAVVASRVRPGGSGRWFLRLSVGAVVLAGALTTAQLLR